MSTKKAPISHDSFLVLYELEALGSKASRQLLTSAVDKYNVICVDKCLKELFFKKRVSKDSYEKLVSYSSDRLENHKTYLFKNTSANHSLVANNSYEKLISYASKMSNPNYRAVVDGKKPRKCALQRYAETCLSRQDVHHFWRMVGEMGQGEKENFTNKIARLIN